MKVRVPLLCVQFTTTSVERKFQFFQTQRKRKMSKSLTREIQLRGLFSPKYTDTPLSVEFSLFLTAQDREEKEKEKPR